MVWETVRWSSAVWFSLILIKKWFKDTLWGTGYVKRSTNDSFNIWPPFVGYSSFHWFTFEMTKGWEDKSQSSKISNQSFNNLHSGVNYSRSKVVLMLCFSRHFHTRISQRHFLFSIGWILTVTTCVISPRVKAQVGIYVWSLVSGQWKRPGNQMALGLRGKPYCWRICECVC